MRRMNHRMITPLLLLALPACEVEATRVVTFVPPDMPEGLALEPGGTLLVSMALTGEVRRIDTRDGTGEKVAQIPLGQCAPNPLPPFISGIAVDAQSNAYVVANTCEADLRGVWKIAAETGEASLHASFAPSVAANGLTIHGDTIYVADSISGDILAAPVAGGALEVAFSDPLLAPTGAVVQGVMLPGSNGIQWFKDSLYVANSSSGDIVRIALDGSEIVTHANVATGCDDFAIDGLGTLLCATDAFHTLLAIFPNGASEIVLDASDGLDGPTSAIFGPRFGSEDDVAPYFTVYVASAAFPLFEGTGNGPSLITFEWPVEGAPR